jgi:hypothetical protein
LIRSSGLPTIMPTAPLIYPAQKSSDMKNGAATDFWMNLIVTAGYPSVRGFGIWDNGVVIAAS